MSSARKATVLKAVFFQRDVLEVTAELLGKNLCRRMPDGSILKLRVCEAEAYDGFEDKACHAACGRTERNAPMFAQGGCWYVYLCYGVHWMLNIVTGERDYPAAVLLRGAGHVVGPGRLTRYLSVDKGLNGMRARRTSGLWFEDDGWVVDAQSVLRTPRIGIDYAQQWRDVPYRFVIKDEA